MFGRAESQATPTRFQFASEPIRGLDFFARQTDIGTEFTTSYYFLLLSIKFMKLVEINIFVPQLGKIKHFMSISEI